MFAFDGIEFWVEEEQFGLGFVGDRKPAIFKYRYHNKAGSEWAANYKLADDLVWGKVIADVGAHPLGSYLGSVVGASLEGKPGYVLMGRIPLQDGRGRLRHVRLGAFAGLQGLLAPRPDVQRPDVADSILVRPLAAELRLPVNAL